MLVHLKRWLIAVLSLMLIFSVAGCQRPGGRDALNAVFKDGDDVERWNMADAQTPEPTGDPANVPTPAPVPDTDDGESEQWTVMLYMNGADLESRLGEATKNLQSLLSVPVPESVNILIYTGGTSEWKNSTISADQNQIWRVEDGTLVLEQNMGAKSMGRSSTLAEFITYSQTAYPSDKKALFLWNHGAGSIIGFGVDEVFGYDSLLLVEMADAFAASADGQKFDIIGFDACLMATVEMASVLAPYAEYMVASEEMEPGGGWNYEYMFGALADDPGMTGEDLGIAITDGYYQKYTNTQNEGIITCSVVDLSKIPVLEDMLGTFASELRVDIVDPETMSQIAQVRQHTERYGEIPGEEPYDLVDLYNFVELQKDNNPQLSASLMSAIEDAVVYEVNGSQRVDSFGLAIYFPFGAKGSFAESLAVYNELDFCPEYKWFAAEFASALTNESYLDLVPEYNNELEEALSEIAGDDLSEIGSYFVQLTPEEFDQLAYVYCALGWYMEDGSVVDLGFDSDLVINYDDLTIHDNFGGWWTGLNGVPVCVYVMEETYDYVIYNIPVLYNGEKAVVRSTWIWDTQEYTYDGIFYSIDDYSVPSAKMSIELQVGDAITPLYITLYAEDGYEGYYEGETFYVGTDGLYLDLIELPDGVYSYGFMFIDNFGNVHFSEFIDFELY